MSCGRMRCSSRCRGSCGPPRKACPTRTNHRTLRRAGLCHRLGWRSGFAPFEFVAENFEVRFVGRLDELEAFGGARDAHTIAALHGHAGLAVEGEKHGIRGLRETQLDL